MTEIDRLRDQVGRAFDGDAWCGPSLMAALAGVTAVQAAARVPGVAHSIGEIVAHVAGWQGVVARRVAGEPTREPERGDWPAADCADEPAWQAALGHLAESHRRLLRALDSFDPARLDDRVGDGHDPAMGRGETAYATLHGAAQHALYHAGQIAILKQLVGAG